MVEATASIKGGDGGGYRKSASGAQDACPDDKDAGSPSYVCASQASCQTGGIASLFHPISRDFRPFAVASYQPVHARGNASHARALPYVNLEATTMSVGTILLIILVIALLGGFSGWGGGPFTGPVIMAGVASVSCSSLLSCWSWPDASSGPSGYPKAFLNRPNSRLTVHCLVGAVRQGWSLIIPAGRAAPEPLWQPLRSLPERHSPQRRRPEESMKCIA